MGILKNVRLQTEVTNMSLRPSEPRSLGEVVRRSPALEACLKGTEALQTDVRTVKREEDRCFYNNVRVL